MQINSGQKIQTDSTQSTKRRPKRRPIDIQRALYSAITQIICEQGFPHLNIQNVAKKSTVSKDIIYKYYQKFDNLLEKYFEQYDFWITFSHNIANRYNTYEEFFKGILNELHSIMDQNNEFQCIIRWEVAAPNEFIVSKAKWREIFCQDMLEKNEKYFIPHGIDIKAIYAILIAGIYYLVLRKNISSFCDIDFSTNKGKERLNQTVEFIGNLLKDHIQKENHYRQIARNLVKRNFSYEEIGEIMQFTPERIEELVKASS